MFVPICSSQVQYCSLTLIWGQRVGVRWFSMSYLDSAYQSTCLCQFAAPKSNIAVWPWFGVKGLGSGDFPCHIWIQHAKEHSCTNFQLPSPILQFDPNLGSKGWGQLIFHVIFGFSMPKSIVVPIISSQVQSCSLTLIRGHLGGFGRWLVHFFNKLSYYEQVQAVLSIYEIKIIFPYFALNWATLLTESTKMTIFKNS